MSANSTKRRKPAKPRPDFPLFAHSNGSWAKKIRGKLYYFGPWGQPAAALQRYVDEKDALHAGRKPRPTTDGVTVRYLCNRFLTGRQGRVNAGELAPRTFADYKRTCARLVGLFGDRLVDDLDPDDFEELRSSIGATCGPTALTVEIARIRMVMKFAHDHRLIKSPVHYGDSFARPPKCLVRAQQNGVGARMFEPADLQRILDEAKQPMRAMVLLGVNCAFGPADIGRLPLSAVNLDSGWIDYPREKTGIARRCSLWNETIESIEEVLARHPRPADKSTGKLVFLRKNGNCWADGTANRITDTFSRLIRKLGIWRKELGFYSLRRTFRTVADEKLDFPACDLIMGHTRPGMGDLYRQRIADDRLVAVVSHVRTWLFGTEETE